MIEQSFDVLGAAPIAGVKRPRAAGRQLPTFAFLVTRRSAGQVCNSVVGAIRLNEMRGSSHHGPQLVCAGSHLGKFGKSLGMF